MTPSAAGWLSRVDSARGLEELERVVSAMGPWAREEPIASALGKAIARAMGSLNVESMEMARFYSMSAPCCMADAAKKNHAEKVLEQVDGVISCPKGREAFMRSWTGVDPRLGSVGLAGSWMQKALLLDDERTLLGLLDAGADPFAFCVSGWHPLDWAWRLDAKRCAVVLACRVGPEELVAIQAWHGGQGSIGEPFAASMPIMSSIMISDEDLSGFESASRVPIESKIWMRQKSGHQFGARSCFQGQLSKMARRQERAAWTPMSPEESMAWWSSSTQDAEQRSWVDARRIEAVIGQQGCAPSDDSAHRRL
jgi:hypothetical protein